MRRYTLILAVALVGCESDGASPHRDAALGDGIHADARGDANGSGGVACGDTSTMCPLPAQLCCDVTTGMDMCIPSNGTCSGTRLECDGPEDCPAAQECCLFPDRSECLDDGICGTTGVITEVMCHVDGECNTAAGEHCCGTAPGPVVDVYGVCRTGACPQ